MIDYIFPLRKMVILAKMKPMKANGEKRGTTMKSIGVMLIIVFGILSLWGANITMMTHSDGMMQQCPFSGSAVKVCAMTARAHISYWQQLFLSEPGKIGAQTMLGILFLFSAFLAVKYFSHFFLFEFVFRPSGGSRAGPPGSLSYNYLYRNVGSGIVHKRE